MDCTAAVYFSGCLQQHVCLKPTEMPGTAYRDIGKNRDARKKDTKGQRGTKSSKNIDNNRVNRNSKYGSLLQGVHQGHKEQKDSDGQTP